MRPTFFPYKERGVTLCDEVRYYSFNWYGYAILSVGFQ